MTEEMDEKLKLYGLLPVLPIEPDDRVWRLHRGEISSFLVLELVSLPARRGDPDRSPVPSARCWARDPGKSGEFILSLSDLRWDVLNVNMFGRGLRRLGCRVSADADPEVNRWLSSQMSKEDVRHLAKYLRFFDKPFFSFLNQPTSTHQP